MPHGRDSSTHAALLVCHVDVADGRADADERIAGLGVASRCGAENAASWNSETEVRLALIERNSAAFLIISSASLMVVTQIQEAANAI